MELLIFLIAGTGIGVILSSKYSLWKRIILVVVFLLVLAALLAALFINGFDRGLQPIRNR